MGVCFVAPGQFVAATWPAGSDPVRRELQVIAHDPLGTIVALWPPRVLVEALATLPPALAFQFVAATWRAATQVVRQKRHLLGLCLRDRVLTVLTTLARDFGCPHPQGVRIELRLTHGDPAAAAVGSRANVTRALEDLREYGLVLVEDHRLVMTRLGLTALAGGSRDAPWAADRAASAH